MSAHTEYWRPAVGWEGHYEISDVGRIRSLARRVPHARHGSVYIRSRIIKQHLGATHWQVRLSREGALHTRRVHQMVLECRECSRIWSRRYHANRKAAVA